MLYFRLLLPGSPPPAWGIRLDLGVVGDELRFTPTCVGNTIAPGGAPAPVLGSPPPAWGIR